MVPAAERRPSLFRNRNFTMLYLGQLVSQFGDWFRTVIMLVILYELHPSEAAVGGMFIASTLPMLFGSILVGPLIDRWNKKHIMITVDILRFFTLMLVIYGVEQKSLWIIYICSAIASLFSSAFQPARTAIIPEVIDSQDTVRATSSFAILTSITMVTASALGGFAADQIGALPILWFDAISYLVSALFISLMSYRPRVRVAKAHVPYFKQIKEGLDYVKGSPQLLSVFWITFARDFVLGFVYILFSIFVLEVVQAGNTGMGVGYSVTAIAYLLGAWLIKWYFRKKSFSDESFFKIFFPFHLLYGIGLGVMFSMTSWFWFLFVLVVAYIFASGVNIIIETSLMTYSKAENRGRVVASWLSSSRLAYAISLPLFSAIGGYIPTHLGGYLLTFICALSALILFIWLRAKLKQHPTATKPGLEA
ncbi:MFS transporter [Tumebacillus lipolyticus]|uniref:MFS transporter n=1 Tax=Tumebacillus lipolyticus TaxID=1280370 RepID=A0ABW5A282_9BACL